MGYRLTNFTVGGEGEHRVTVGGAVWRMNWVEASWIRYKNSKCKIVYWGSFEDRKTKSRQIQYTAYLDGYALTTNQLRHITVTLVTGIGRFLTPKQKPTTSLKS